MAASKRQRPNACTPEPPAAIEWTIPMELLLEIVARSDTHTLVHAAAACKLLRLDILSLPFIRRVTQQGGIVPPRILAYLITDGDKTDQPQPPLSLVFPATPVTVSFLVDHISPYMSRSADDLLREHCPVSSRGGLVLLRRRHFSNTLSNLCVYNPITGHRTFLSYPPGINLESTRYLDSCILLTAADGIDCDFLLFFPSIATRCFRSNRRTIKVHIASSTCSTWAPADMSGNVSYLLLQRWFAISRDAIVIHGGVIHWFVRRNGLIVTYNVCTGEHGTVNLPGPINNFKGALYLVSYDRPMLLCILGATGFKISMWHQLPSGDWPLEAVTINTEEKLRSIYPDLSPDGSFLTFLQYTSKGRSAVLLRIYCNSPSANYRVLLFDLDLETMEMLVQPDSVLSSILLEVDLPSRLRGMKIFS